MEVEELLFAISVELLLRKVFTTICFAKIAEENLLLIGD
jgi:hypothetical protein